MRVMVRQFPDWWLPMSLDAAIGTIAAPVRDLLSSMHEELSRLYPLLEDSPVHLIVQDCISTLEKDPRLWKKRNREEIVTLLDETLRNKVASCLPFSTAISVK